MTIFAFPNADDFLMGASASFNLLGGPTSVLPTEIITQTKYFSIGRIMRLMEVQRHIIFFKWPFPNTNCNPVISFDSSLVSVLKHSSSCLAPAFLDLKAILASATFRLFTMSWVLHQRRRGKNISCTMTPTDVGVHCVHCVMSFSA